MSPKPKRRLKAWIYFPLSLIITAVAAVLFVVIFGADGSKEREILANNASASSISTALNATASTATASTASASNATGSTAINTQTIRIFPYKRNGLWGYKNQAGAVLVDAQYKDATDFSEGYAWVAQLDTGKYGLISQDSFEVSGGFLYDEVRPFSEGMAAVKREGLWGFANTSGIIQISAVYSGAWDFSAGYARVTKDGKYFYIDPSGRSPSTYEYDSAQDFKETDAGILAFIGKKNDGSSMSYFVVSPLKELYPVGNASGSIFSENLAVVKLASGKYTYYDTMGNDAMNQKEFEMAKDFSEGLAAVQKDTRWGFIDVTGVTKVNEVYQDAQSFSDGYAAVNDGVGWYYINQSNDRIMPQLTNEYYTRAEPFKDGYARVVLNNTFMAIDANGNSTELYTADPEDLQSSYTATIKTEGGTLNMRSAPDQGADVVMKLPNNSSVTVLENTANNWCFIQYEDAKGYVDKKFVFEEN